MAAQGTTHAVPAVFASSSLAKPASSLNALPHFPAAPFCDQGEEMRLKAAIKENDDLKKEQFKRSQRLFELRTKERELISEISGGQGQNKNLAARISQMDEQLCACSWGWV